MKIAILEAAVGGTFFICSQLPTRVQFFILLSTKVLKDFLEITKMYLVWLSPDSSVTYTCLGPAVPHILSQDLSEVTAESKVYSTLTICRQYLIHNKPKLLIRFHSIWKSHLLNRSLCFVGLKSMISCNIHRSSHWLTVLTLLVLFSC